MVSRLDLATRLERLLAGIDPDRTSQVTYRRANEAINTFRAPAKIEKWNEFKAAVMRYSNHVESCILNLREPIDETSEFYWPRCVRVLLDIYGINGEKASFEMARTGNEGGLYAVLKAVAMNLAEKYAQNEISARISAYWQNLSVDEQLQASSEYIARYGHLLPSELTEGSAARIRANFPKVLKKHHDLIEKIRRVGR